jgi:hypothetical protein
MRRLIPTLALVLAACAGPPGDPWVLRPQHGGPTLAEHVAAEAEVDPEGTARAVGGIIGTVGMIVLNILLIGR